MYPSERIDDIINKECSATLGIDIDLVEQVIRFQFKSANEATRTSTSVELTDFGIFKATKVKLDRKLKTFGRKLEYLTKHSNDSILTDRKKRAIDLTINSVKNNIAYAEHKRKVYEN